MTLLGKSPTGSQQMPWESFYNLILAHTKLHDHSTASTTKTTRSANIHERGGGGRRGGRGRGQPCAGRGSGAFTRTPRADYVFTTVTGHNMIMKANMKFKPEEWNKLTAEQKTQLRVSKNFNLDSLDHHHLHCRLTQRKYFLLLPLVPLVFQYQLTRSTPSVIQSKCSYFYSGHSASNG
jgi:hypothetical protein